MKTFALEVLPELYAICRLDASAPPPDWGKGTFVSLTRTPNELSIVCPQANVPANIRADRDWRCLRVSGVLDFAMTNVIASLSGTLAEAEISIFVVSSFDTDYLLVKARQLEEAIESLTRAGHTALSVPHDPDEPAR